MESMTKDDQPIERVTLLSGVRKPTQWVVDDHITIVIYEENGSMAPMPWVAIIEHGRVIHRVAAQHCIVSYL